MQTVLFLRENTMYAIKLGVCTLNTLSHICIFDKKNDLAETSAFRSAYSQFAWVSKGIEIYWTKYMYIHILYLIKYPSVTPTVINTF